jgi:hypothetical protein
LRNDELVLEGPIMALGDLVDRDRGPHEVPKQELLAEFRCPEHHSMGGLTQHELLRAGHEPVNRGADYDVDLRCVRPGCPWFKMPYVIDRDRLRDELTRLSVYRGTSDIWIKDIATLAVDP